jgi:hypothetical protein
VEGGSCNAYDYVCGDAINDFDLAGTVCLKCGWANVKRGAQVAGSWVYENSGSLSTALSYGSSLGYAFCAFSGGTGCVVGLALSAASSTLSAVNVHRACKRGGKSCTGAQINLGVSVVGTVTGGIATAKMNSAVASVRNRYIADVYEVRQAAVAGAIANGGSALTGTFVE